MQTLESDNWIIKIRMQTSVGLSWGNTDWLPNSYSVLVQLGYMAHSSAESGQAEGLHSEKRYSDLPQGISAPALTYIRIGLWITLQVNQNPSALSQNEACDK